MGPDTFMANISPVLMKANSFQKTLWQKTISENDVKKKTILLIRTLWKKIHFGKRREKEAYSWKRGKKNVIHVYH